MERRGIELLPISPPTGRSKIVSFWARTIGIPLILGLQLVFLGAFAFRAKLELDLRVLSSSVKEKEQTLAASTDLEEIFRSTQLKLETIHEVKQKLCYSCTIRKLNEIKPAAVVLTSHSFENEKLSLTAETPPGVFFGSFVSNIVQEKGVQEAALTSGSLNREGNFIFTMELVLDKDNLR